MVGAQQQDKDIAFRPERIRKSHGYGISYVSHTTEKEGSYVSSYRFQDPLAQQDTDIVQKQHYECRIHFTCNEVHPAH